jgi:NAD(P)-dependent dehydrogenase (short-subunit alcohol dehydrogenase family)
LGSPIPVDFDPFEAHMSDKLFSVQGKVTLVSGGSRGIGAAIAHGFAERGAKVIITGRDADALASAAKAMSSPENAVAFETCDVANVQAIRDTVAKVHKQHGRIDTLINVAGVNRRKRVEEVTEEDYDFILDINLKGAFLMAQEVGRLMIAQKNGSQIHIGSLNNYAPLTGVAPYAVSKGGLLYMTRALALEWGRLGVRVNNLAPGFILTDLTRKLWSDPTMQAWAKTNTPLGRLGEVNDLIGAAIFLASDAAAFVTGQTLLVDGGVSAGSNWPIPL